MKTSCNSSCKAQKGWSGQIIRPKCQLSSMQLPVEKHNLPSFHYGHNLPVPLAGSFQEIHFSVVSHLQYLVFFDITIVKFVLCGLIMQNTRKDQPPLSEYQLAWHPDNLRLQEVVNKVVHSNWLHIANAGLIGSDSECPRLPEELKWACEKGHNIESYKLSLVMSKILGSPGQIIFQSEHLLTNLVLWLLWHFNGHLRIVVSGEIVYDKTLGPEDCTIECRVSKRCSKEDRCSASNKFVPTFEMFENVSGSFQTLFRGKYDSMQTLMSEPQVRQKLYHSPIQYPKGSQSSIKIQTQRTAQELLRWFIERPVSSERAISSSLDFNVLLESGETTGYSGLRVGDLLGKTPGLLNMQCGDMGRTFIVFSLPRETTPPTVENFMEMSSDDMEMDDDAENFEEMPEMLLNYFPILQDLTESVRLSCKCFNCKGPNRNFFADQNCLRNKAFMEVMLFFAHGIADAFGAPDVSGCAESLVGDSGAMSVLKDLVGSVMFNPEKLSGTVCWNTLLSTST